MVGRLWFVPTSVAIGQLEFLLPYIRKKQLTDYRNQIWCQNLAYAQGQFSQNNQVSACNLFDGEALPFTTEARADFQTLRRQLRGTGLRIAFINAYWTDNQLASAEFDLNCWFFSRTRYIYEPNYALPEDIENEMWFTPINQNWFQANEDWN
jgi:hypothetical protein